MPPVPQERYECSLFESYVTIADEDVTEARVSTQSASRAAFASCQSVHRDFGVARRHKDDASRAMSQAGQAIVAIEATTPANAAQARAFFHNDLAPVFNEMMSVWARVRSAGRRAADARLEAANRLSRVAAACESSEQACAWASAACQHLDADLARQAYRLSMDTKGGALRDAAYAEWAAEKAARISCLRHKKCFARNGYELSGALETEACATAQQHCCCGCARAVTDHFCKAHTFHSNARM